MDIEKDSLKKTNTGNDTAWLYCTGGSSFD